MTSPAAARAERGEVRVFRPAPSRPLTAAVARAAAPPVAAPARSADDLRRQEAERARLNSAQQQRRDALERQHNQEIRQPPRGMSPGQLQQQHEAEHRAMTEQVAREHQLLQNRHQPGGEARGGATGRAENR